MLPYFKVIEFDFLITDSRNFDFFLIKTYKVKYGFATGLLLYVITLQTICKVYQANRTIVTANVTLLNALVLVWQELTFHPFHVFVFSFC